MTDKEKLQHIEQLESDIEKSCAKKEYLEQRVTQLEHQLSSLEARARNSAQRKRTHRLIVRGAILESLIPDAENYTDEQIKHILLSMIGAIPDKLREELFGSHS